MDIANLLIYGLAVWRISSLLVNEEGPWYIFWHIRSKLGHMHDLDMNYIGHKDGFLSDTFACVWCLSIWVAIAVSIGRYFFSAPTFYICLALALSAVAIVVERVAGNDT